MWDLQVNEFLDACGWMMPVVESFAALQVDMFVLRV